MKWISKAVMAVSFVSAFAGVSARATTSASYFREAFDYWTQNSGAIAQSCPNEYEKVFSKDEFFLQLVIGYYDFGSRVFDRVTHDELVRRLTAPCQDQGHQLCGFRGDPTSDGFQTVLRKEIVGPKGKSVQFKIGIKTSSASEDDRANRNSADQVRASEEAERAYFNSFYHADGVFYLGHSRSGGGPDFEPPRKLKNGHIDYPFYLRTRPGLKTLLDSLAYESPKARVTGIFSCDSHDYFFRKIQGYFPTGTMFFLTSKVTENEFLAMLTGLNGLIGMQCQSEVNQALGSFDATLVKK